METNRPALLLTNDDGIDAPGLAALVRAIDGLGDSHAIVAPADPQSGCGHRVTTHATIASDHRSDGIAVQGTPADCVRLGLHLLAPKSTWVIAGINAGGNLGTDIHHSGTVAAVREGVIRGIPGIAVSHYIARGRAIDWDRAAARARGVIARLLELPCPAGAFWNINLPHPPADAPEPEVVFCPVDPSPLPLDFRHEPEGLIYSGDYQRRERVAGFDVDVCFSGKIAVSLVQVTCSLDPSCVPGLGG
ncbi:MAG: 5'/3'-nucleotidase SurE [Isosphaeraceae bacterium]|nr:5'/3'-nucleotidase SurE [Isosphaeraceae bacterium]